MQRRTFFKSSLTLAALLVAWRQGVLVHSEKVRSQIPEFNLITKTDIVLLNQFLPVVLPFENWTIEKVSTYSSRFDVTVSFMVPCVQKEIRQLFDLLNLKPFLWLNGLSSLESSSIASRSKFLISLKNSRISDFRAAGHGFCELLSAVYYSDPSSFMALDYHPPLDLL